MTYGHTDKLQSDTSSLADSIKNNMLGNLVKVCVVMQSSRFRTFPGRLSYIRKVVTFMVGTLRYSWLHHALLVSVRLFSRCIAVLAFVPIEHVFGAFGVLVLILACTVSGYAQQVLPISPQHPLVLSLHHARSWCCLLAYCRCA